ncbi:MAG: histidine phosphatase family protein [Bacteroidales bacterium]|nr:histidine phosphatase family protein [Bacteroidales bacterium]
MRASRIISILALSVVLTVSAYGKNETAADHRAAIEADHSLAAGLHTPYPDDAYTAPLAAPKGFQPVYIYHFGRHGSRYRSKCKDIKSFLDQLGKAGESGLLTEQGMDVLRQVRSYYDAQKGHDGELSAVGEREQRRIAERLYNDFPMLFSGSTHISARSTFVLRTLATMGAFCERIKELNPSLDIYRETSKSFVHSEFGQRSKGYNAMMAHDTPWYKEYRKIRQANFDGKRISGVLFKSASALKSSGIRPYILAKSLYDVATCAPNIDVECNILDLFTTDELYNMWQVRNIHQCVEYGACDLSREVMGTRSDSLILSIVKYADEALSTGNTTATLRFGHDANIAPLLADLGAADSYAPTSDIREICHLWSTFELIPMAANFDFIFYRNAGGKVIVQVRLNERPCELPRKKVYGGFYDWKKLRAYMLSRAR